MTPALAHSKAFAVWFKDLERWSVSSFFRIRWKWPATVIHPLAAALERKSVAVERSRFPLDQLHLVTLHFDGEMEPRDMQRKASFKGRLFFAEAGDVIYSKIDVRNGAIGVVPSSLPKVAVSSEYPVYHVRPKVSMPEYVKVLFRTPAFRQQINSMISGASGRKRVQPLDLEEVKVPLPPLSVQEAIVAHWRRTQEAAAKSRETIAKLEADTLSRFFHLLGLQPPKAYETPKAFAVWWKNFFRWSVSYNQAALDILDVRHGRYRVSRLGELLARAQYGTSEKANQAGRGTPVLRINNIKGGCLDLTDLKYIELPQRVLASLSLADGDILIIRTSGSRDLVGTCAVFHGADRYAFASYLIRLCVDRSKALSDYVAYFINSPLGRQQIDTLSRQIMQNNVNSEELRSLLIPVPPLEVQREIVDMVNRQRTWIAEERKAAEERRVRAAREAEEMILGVRPVG